MIYRTGACDSFVFTVNQLAGSPYRSGVNRSRFEETKIGIITGREIEHPWQYLWRNNAAGELVHWEFASTEYEPFFWAFTDGSTGVNAFWESEIKPDDVISESECPMITNYPRDQLNGGSSLRAYLPTLTDLSAFESTVTGTTLSTVTWINSSKYSSTKTTKQLLNELFTDKQISRELEPIPTIDKVKEKYLDVTNYTMYNLLWLRSASQIIHNHRAETIIPLVKNNMTIDSDGYLSI